MIYFIDIDETICTTPEGQSYHLAKPNQGRIALVNQLVDAGHQVVYWTARGTATGIDWRDVTERQLGRWGARYTELRFGKPVYDVLVDDRAFTNFEQAGIRREES